jgi:PleD family two-component response regulator
MSDALRVLLIDDDQLDRMSVVRALKRGTRRYDITEAESATIGLRYAAERKFDVILLDYRMPDMDGIEVLHQLRSGSGPRVAVLMLSRLEDEALAERCLDAGAQDFLLKDEVDHRRLARALRQARQRNQIEEALQASRNELLELSEHDALTGLTNRRGFERALATAAARATRGTDEFALVLLDLDDFKSVNDTDGHDVGDALLVEVTRRLSATIRDSDLLCRLGGG